MRSAYENKETLSELEKEIEMKKYLWSETVKIIYDELNKI